MSNEIKTVTIIGATGNLGSPILQALVSASNPSFTITVLTRGDASFPASVTVRRLKDWSLSALTAAFRDQDAVISAVGMTGFADQKTMIDAAVAAGVKRFIPSEFSANTMADAVTELVPVFKLKRDTIDYLVQIQASSGLTWTGLGAGGLFDWGLQVGFLGYNLTAHTATIWDSGTTPFTLTNVSTVGKAVVSILRHPAETANKYLYVGSVTTNQNEILHALEKATGGGAEKKWAVTHTTTEAEIKAGREMIAAGDLTGNFKLVLASCVGEVEGTGADFRKEKGGLANGLLGLEEEDVEGTIERLVSA